MAAVVAILATPPAGAADIVLTPSAGAGVTISNSAGNATRLRVADDGTFTLPGLAAASGARSGDGPLASSETQGSEEQEREPSLKHRGRAG